jgi:hypothetical protein
VTAAQHSSSDHPIASDAAREPQALPPPQESRDVRPEPMEETDESVITRRAVALHEKELAALLRRIAGELLQNIRRAPARPELRP